MKQPLDKGTPQRCSVIIIGAGESGVAVGCLLRSKLGVTDFRIFDRQGGIGGAWYINRYPGVACDIPALFYSYSFAPNYEWTALFPPGREIQQYLVSVCQKFGVLENIQLNVEVTEARWLPECSEWEVRVARLVPFAGDLSEAERQRRLQQHGHSSVYLEREASVEILRSKVLITCAGELVEPNVWPKDVPGLDRFQGDVMHSARWRDEVSLTDKHVVVLGTGCTSVQLVPSLLNADRREKGRPKYVTQLMRTAPWVMARPTTPPAWFNRIMTALQLVPGLGRWFRWLLFLYAESTWLNVGMGWFGRERRRLFQKSLLAHLRKTVPEGYREMLTPNFGVGCRRIIIDAGWLECLSSQDRVELTTRPLVSVGDKSVVLGPVPPATDTGAAVTIDGASPGEITKPADVIILANGFDTSTYVHRLKILNAAGKSLHDVWRERAEQNGPEKGGVGAYLSTAVHGFPNFFMVLGPCAVSGHSSAILASENVAGYALNFVRLVLSGEAHTVDVKPEAELRYTADVQKRSADKVWQACRGGYITKAGWNSSICPFNQIHFSIMCKFPRWKDWNVDYTARGTVQRQSRQRRYVSIWAFIVAAFVLVSVRLLLLRR